MTNNIEISKEKSCACKGIRTCLLCESNISKVNFNSKANCEVLTFCLHCRKAWSPQNFGYHPSHHGEGLPFEGVTILPEFIAEAEEKEFCEIIDRTQFVDSQSGRRKQDYGPKVNFKRKKVKKGNFNGLPEFSKTIFGRMRQTDILKDFEPVELCNLDYNSERGSAIDPHFDDFWIWGERLVTLNLLSDSVLSMTCEDYPQIEVHIPLLRRSLIVIYGPARNIWKHAIHRRHITGRRLAVTLRELAEEFQLGHANEAIGKEMLDIAQSFSGTAV